METIQGPKMYEEIWYLTVHFGRFALNEKDSSSQGSMYCSITMLCRVIAVRYSGPFSLNVFFTINAVVFALRTNTNILVIDK